MRRSIGFVPTAVTETETVSSSSSSSSSSLRQVCICKSVPDRAKHLPISFDNSRGWVVVNGRGQIARVHGYARLKKTKRKKQMEIEKHACPAR